MPIPRHRILIGAFGLCAFLGLSPRAHSQAALLMEEPYGFFGTVNPTGHNAIYFARICAETPVKLRRCGPGEPGSVIARYQGIAGYDWVAMPLIPYLYSVEQIADVPTHVDRRTVTTLRDRYHEQHLGALGANVFEGGFTHGGWNQLIGTAYERRIYAFRFDTTPEQDDALIERMNDSKNKSEFNLTFNNCADFARGLLNQYFPGTFKRAIFPDAGMTTPRQIAYKLVKYSKKHPETDLVVYEIPQVPGYRHHSHSNKSISGSIITTGYVIPIVLLNPYLAGGIFVDYLVRGRYPLIEGHPPALTPDQLSVLASFPKAPSAPAVPSSVTSTMAAGHPIVVVSNTQTLPTTTAVAAKATPGAHD
ncbi:hypothetical protein [Terracidiphilus gabretensis]|jgi:hypothetical protein|uniref:hypothetical protein n=1 Tax=Terracidiphilus gabretensis TaxID=1577687 RepID=UPI00071C1B88|nr:hypothetical protein [Terracidiphilus gabretensis]